MVRKAAALALAVILTTGEAQAVLRTAVPVRAPALTTGLPGSGPSVRLTAPSSLSGSLIWNPVLTPGSASPLPSLRGPAPAIAAAAPGIVGAARLPSPASPPARALTVLKKLKTSPPRSASLRFDGSSFRGAFEPPAGTPVPARSRTGAPRRAGLYAGGEHSYKPSPLALPSPARAPPAGKRRFGFKTGVVLGIAAAAGVPIFWEMIPPIMGVNAGLLALIAAGGLWTAAQGLKLASAVLRQFTGGARKKPRLPMWAGVLLGASLAALPIVFSPQAAKAELDAVSYAAERWEDMLPDRNEYRNTRNFLDALQSTKEIEHAGSGLAERAASVLGETPAGREMLDKLRDRAGRLRMPDIFFAELGSYTGARYIAPFDAVFIQKSRVEAKGWTVEEVRNDPKKQRALVVELRTTLFHELFHATQARRAWVVPGQLENFPSQITTILALETEFETHITEQYYVHDLLKADRGAELGSWDLSGYEDYLDDFDAFLKDIEEHGAYNKVFKHIDSKYYRAFLDAKRAEWGPMSVEGYLLLAERFEGSNPAKARLLREKAAKRAAELGIAIPAAAPAPRVS